MQFLTKILLVLFVLNAAPLSAEENVDAHRVKQRSHTVNGYDVAIDMALRPLSFIATIAGAALYVGLSPLTAVSQAFPPHNSFEKLGKLLVVQPAKYTFSRDVGDYTYESSY